MADFHADELIAQAHAGHVLGGTPAIRPFMPEQHRLFFAGLPYLLIGTADAAGAPVATLLTGAPGFVQSPDATHLAIAAALDPTDPAVGSLVPGAEAGILGIDLATRRRNRANGRIVGRDRDGLAVAVDQSFGNCPQYIQRRAVEPVPRRPGSTEILSALDTEAEALIDAADTLFVATRSRDGLREGGADISHRGGRPGFVRRRGNVLTVPDFSGNRYFNTLGNLIGEPRAAVLFLDFASGDLLVLQGRTEIDWTGAAGLLGAQRSWSVTITGGWRRRAVVPLRWSDPEPAPQLARTGIWAEAEGVLRS
jgi:predicted pyridoxine 5'-phosphate oxidase superfamily flavin-nucleotide-binding protein